LIKATHAKDLDEAHDKAAVASDASHAAELKELQLNHTEAIAVLQKEHATAQQGLTTDVEKRQVSHTYHHMSSFFKY
jgi:hypothetical protein